MGNAASITLVGLQACGALGASYGLHWLSTRVMGFNPYISSLASSVTVVGLLCFTQVWTLSFPIFVITTLAMTVSCLALDHYAMPSRAEEPPSADELSFSQALSAWLDCADRGELSWRRARGHLVITPESKKDETTYDSKVVLFVPEAWEHAAECDDSIEVIQERIEVLTELIPWCEKQDWTPRQDKPIFKDTYRFTVFDDFVGLTVEKRDPFAKATQTFLTECFKKRGLPPLRFHNSQL